MMPDLQSTLLAIIVFQSLLFALILLTNRGPKRLSNRILAIFLLFLGGQMGVILGEGLTPYPQWVLQSLCVFGFVYGPLLYLYTASLIYRDWSWRAGLWWHFVPAAVMLSGPPAGYPLCPRFGSLLYLSLIAYLVLAICQLFRYRSAVANTRSTSARIDLGWLQWTMVIFSLTFLLDLIDHFFADVSLFERISMVHLTILLLVNWMFYKGLKQPTIFLGITYQDEQLRTVATQHSPEERAEVQAELDRIRSHLDRSRPYTDPQLSLDDLAEQLQLPPRRLSMFINTHFGQNFMAFINGYRIELARERLANPADPKETILEVMYEVGFNSKSSFNTLFKQQTGLTPSEYKKKHAR